MKPPKKAVKFHKICFCIFILVFIIPKVLLSLTHWWVIRFISIPLFWLCGATFFLLEAFGPVEYMLSPRNSWRTPKFIGTSRVIAFIVGFAALIFFSFYCKGVVRFVLDGGKLEKVSGVIKRVDAQFPSSMFSVDFKIEGRANEISLYHWPRGVCRRFPPGSKAEFSLLPGTDYAMDVKPIPGDQ
jgi:hypothetical protein